MKEQSQSKEQVPLQDKQPVKEHVHDEHCTCSCHCGEHHDHEHHHGLFHHHHEHKITSLNRAFIIGIVLNTAFVVVEFIVGFIYDSMGLLSDAGHNLSDVASLLLAMLAFRLAQVHANSHYTYGYKKSTVLISLLNSALLFAAVGIIIYESIRRFFEPVLIEGEAIAWTAGLGVLVNGVTAWLFVKDKDHDLNVKGAFLHMAADALVSVGVVVSGLLISFTNWVWIDPVIALLVVGMIIASVWSLLHDSIRLSLDGVPSGIDVGHLIEKMLEVEGVENVHHLHVWAISTTENALTAHVAIQNMENYCEVKHLLKTMLKEEGVGHATLEFEAHGEVCCDHNCQ